MKKYLFAIVAVFLMAVGLYIVWSNDQSESSVRVHIIGDSTMADYVENTTRTRGWG